MKRQLSNPDENLSNKLLTKDKKSSCSTLSLADEYYIYWLDELHNNLLKHYSVEQSRLRAIIDYLQTFNQFDQFKTIVQENVKNTVFIIVNSSSADKVLTLFNDMEQVHSIYIYRDNENIDQSIIDQYKTYEKVSFHSYFLFYIKQLVYC